MDHQINPFKPLMTRVEKERIDAMIEESKEDLEAAGQPQAPAEETELSKNPLAEQITIDDFAKLDLRVATIKEAGLVEGADKLVRLAVDLGEGRLRQVFAGIRGRYPAPESLVGKQVIVEVDATRRDRHQPQQGECRRRLSRARLADDTERRAALDGKADAIDGMHDLGRREPVLAARFEMNLEVLYADQVGIGRSGHTAPS